jgi:hypothetical protein
MTLFFRAIMHLYWCLLINNLNKFERGFVEVKSVVWLERASSSGLFDARGGCKVRADVPRKHKF